MTQDEMEDFAMSVDALYDAVKALPEEETAKFAKEFWPLKTLTDQLSDLFNWAEQRQQELEEEDA